VSPFSRPRLAVPKAEIADTVEDPALVEEELRSSKLRIFIVPIRPRAGGTRFGD
jgi:hypothetical protein